jgi:hypothetical protein
MGTTKQIPIPEWRDYFDRFSRDRLSGDQPLAVTIEVVSPDLGDQYEAQTVRLLGLSYDPKSESFSVDLDDVADHVVSRPGEIWIIEEEDGFISALELACEDGRREIVHLWRSGSLAPQVPDPLAGLP